MADEQFRYAWLMEIGSPIAARWWSGYENLSYEGEVWTGTSDELGRPFVSVSPVDISVGAPQRRLSVSIASNNETFRSRVLGDLGPITVAVRWAYSRDHGKSWSLVQRRFSGRLSRGTLDENNVWTGEIETWLGDASRGRVRTWSDEDQMREFPGDVGLSQMRELESSLILGAWPP